MFLKILVNLHLFKISQNVRYYNYWNRVSRFHNMSITVMKMYYNKKKPYIFCNDSFKKYVEIISANLHNQLKVPLKN